jgi:hypothetical protein
MSDSQGTDSVADPLSRLREITAAHAAGTVQVLGTGTGRAHHDGA